MDTKSSAISFPILFLSFAFIFIPAFALRSCEFPAIFGFGDSNSDTGSYQASYVALNPPYGETYFQKPTRASDGRLIIDFIAEKLKIPYIDAYLNSTGTNFTNGVNFAIGGAAINPNVTGSPFNFQNQYLQFLQFKRNSQLIRKQGGVFAKLMPKKQYFSKGLYILDIAQNDIGIVSGKSIQEINDSIPIIINQFSTIVENIYKSGGRSFWIFNALPIGCMPYIFTTHSTAEKDEVGCAKIYNQLAEYFNFKLNESTVQLRTKYTLATFVYVDIYSVKYSLFTSPHQYGFELPLVACCGYGGIYNFSLEATCGNKIEVNGEEIVVNSCNDPSTRVVWDGFHFTDAANKFVFNKVSYGAFSHPHLPLEMSCHNAYDFDGEIGDPTKVPNHLGNLGLIMMLHFDEFTCSLSF